jgi:repressor LexA
MALTRRQKEILDFIESFLDAHGYSPSFEEIAKFFQYRSLATVHEHLSNLEAKGYGTAPRRRGSSAARDGGSR